METTYTITPNLTDRSWTSRRTGAQGTTYTLTHTPEGLVRAALRATELMDQGRVKKYPENDGTQRGIEEATRYHVAAFIRKLAGAAQLGYAALSLAEKIGYEGSTIGARQLAELRDYQPEWRGLTDRPLDSQIREAMHYADRFQHKETATYELTWLAHHELRAPSERQTESGRWHDTAVSLHPAFTGYAMCSIVCDFRADAPTTLPEAHAYAEEELRLGRSEDTGYALRNAFRAMGDQWRAGLLYQVTYELRLPVIQKDPMVNASATLAQAPGLASLLAENDPTTTVDPDQV